MKKNLIFLIAGMAILIIVGLFIYLIKMGKIQPLAAGEATLWLFPSTNIISVDKTFGVNIIADPAGAQAAGVQVSLLHFDKNYLEVQEFINGDSIFTTYMNKNIDNINGTFSVDAMLAGGTSFNSQKTVGTVRFKAKSAITSTAVTFDCCDVGQSAIMEFGTGVNLISDSQFAIGGAYTLQSSSTPTPTPTKTPTAPSTATPTVTPMSGPTSEPTATPTEISQPDEPTVVEPPSGGVGSTSPQASPSGTPIAYTSPDEFYSPLPTATPNTAVAGFSRSAKITLIIIGGLGILIIVGFLVWQWYRKKKGTAEPPDDEII